MVPRLPPPPSPQDELAISVSAHIPALEVAVTSEQARLMGGVVSPHMRLRHVAGFHSLWCVAGGVRGPSLQLARVAAPLPEVAVTEKHERAARERQLARQLQLQPADKATLPVSWLGTASHSCPCGAGRPLKQALCGGGGRVQAQLLLRRDLKWVRKHTEWLLFHLRTKHMLQRQSGHVETSAANAGAMTGGTRSLCGAFKHRVCHVDPDVCCAVGRRRSGPRHGVRARRSNPSTG